MRKPLTDRNANWEDLAPFVAERAKIALAECKDLGYPLALFEGYRSPERQAELYAQGRTTPGRKVTNAKPWMSWHQYHLGLDIAYFDGKKWYWPKEEEAWERPAAIFEDLGFEWLFPYERVHFQMTGGVTIKEAKEFETMDELWATVHARVLRQTRPPH